jgi:hypothetical protein
MKGEKSGEKGIVVYSVGVIAGCWIDF